VLAGRDGDGDVGASVMVWKYLGGAAVASRSPGAGRWPGAGGYGLGRAAMAC
jgi:hypothetical protein